MLIKSFIDGFKLATFLRPDQTSTESSHKVFQSSEKYFPVICLKGKENGTPIYPVCTLCCMKFSKMEYLNIHMKNMHQETDDMGIQRLTKTVKASVSPTPSVIQEVLEPKLTIFDCTDCGLIFKTSEEHMAHINMNHQDFFLMLLEWRV